MGLLLRGGTGVEVTAGGEKRGGEGTRGKGREGKGNGRVGCGACEPAGARGRALAKDGPEPEY